MALNLITNPPTTLALSSEWLTFVTRSNANMIGHGLSIPIFTLKYWDGSTTKPQIAEGSIIEVGGSFYQADADTALTDEGGLIDGTVHIKLVPSAGSPDPLTVVPTLTNDAMPVWDAVKGGWYDSDDKFLPYEFTKASAVYTEKSEFTDQNKLIKKYADGRVLVPEYGAIGSIVIASSNSFAVNTQYLPNTTYAGSTLYRSTNSGASIFAPLNAHNNGQLYVDSSAWVSLGLTGTWRLSTRIYKGSSSTLYPVGLFQRIS